MKKVNYEKARTQIAVFLRESTPYVEYIKPSEELKEEASMHSVIPFFLHPSNQLIGTAYLNRMAAETDFQIILNQNRLYALVARSFHRRNIELPTEQRNLTTKLKSAFYQRIQSWALSKFYGWLIEDNFRQSALRRYFAIKSLKELVNEGLKVDREISNELERVPEELLN